MIEGILLRNGHFGVDAGPENLRLFGGASRDRTVDLIVANSQLCPRRRDNPEARVTQKGSVHAALVAVRCPSPIPERPPPIRPHTGRDGRVMTQTTTQNASPSAGTN